MEATMDLSAIFEQQELNDTVFASLKELAFANTESFDRFRTLISELDQSLTAGRPDAASHALKLGSCYHAIENFAKAEQWLNTAPAGPRRSLNLARLYRDQRKFDEALREIDQARNQGGDRTECELQRAETYIACGQIDAALPIIDQSASVKESSAQWNYLEGRLAQAGGELERAARSYERALELEEEHPHALFHLAYLANLFGDDEAALQHYQDCASLPYVYTNALINLAVMYEDDGDYDEAAKCLRRVLATSPNHPRAQLYLKDILSAQEMYYDEAQVEAQQQYDAVMDIPVTDFELSVRARNCLKKMNIFTLGDLLRISERELLAYKNFGETSLNEIKAMLTQKGLALGQLSGESAVPASDATATATAAAAPTSILQGDSELMTRPVSSLQLSVRARKCLQRLGLNSVGELIRTSEPELLASKNFGLTSLSEIKQRLGEIDLSLRSID
ncbi:MAG: tetratricopeptide repeat protein [Planctomycetota bacterium]|nr:tetratricopeptide repeat protein [Planctomycetota bacterium]